MILKVCFLDFYASASHGNFLEMQILGPHLISWFRNSRSGAWFQRFYADEGLRTTVLTPGSLTSGSLLGVGWGDVGILGSYPVHYSLWPHVKWELERRLHGLHCPFPAGVGLEAWVEVRGQIITICCHPSLWFLWQYNSMKKLEVSGLLPTNQLWSSVNVSLECLIFHLVACVLGLHCLFS